MKELAIKKAAASLKESFQQANMLVPRYEYKKKRKEIKIYI